MLIQFLVDDFHTIQQRVNQDGYNNKHNNIKKQQKEKCTNGPTIYNYTQHLH